MDRPFAILDKFGDELSAYTNQDRLLDALYSLYRRTWYVHDVGRVHPTTLSLVYFDDNETIHVLSYADDILLWNWYKQMDKLTLDVRMHGTDIFGLTDYITLTEGWPINYVECDCPPTTLCFTRYVAEVDIEVDQHAWDRGATRSEALARAFLTRKQHGQS